MDDEATCNCQRCGQNDAKKATGVKATDAADAYEHILTIQNAAARAEFKLGIFPPNHHVPPATPTPTPAPTSATPAK